jgi:pimeloyl-ACP methyl ester carboxylesterase
LSEPSYLTRPDGLRLAYHHRPGVGPAVVFLPGYMSDMEGGKALAVEAWAVAQGREVLRLDYSGCGASDGAFEDGTLDIWRDDALMLIDTLVAGPFIVVGSSMGGWLALLIALARPDRVAGLVGIAAAPDFTDWGFSEAEIAEMEAKGRLVEDTPYGDDPYVTTLAFRNSGQANLLLGGGEIAIDCPVRLLQGQEDPDVPWRTALRIAEGVRSSDVQAVLIKDGDHRLSRDADIALLIRTIAQMPEAP